jgi:hypothetical protein
VRGRHLAHGKTQPERETQHHARTTQEEDAPLHRRRPLRTAQPQPGDGQQPRHRRAAEGDEIRRQLRRLRRAAGHPGQRQGEGEQHHADARQQQAAADAAGLGVVFRLRHGAGIW